MVPFLKLFVVLFFFLPSNARTLPYTLDIVHEMVAPDGFRRSAVTINGTSPGPVITLNKGDDAAVHVNNMLSDRSMNLTTSIVRLSLGLSMLQKLTILFAE